MFKMCSSVLVHFTIILFHRGTYLYILCYVQLLLFPFIHIAAMLALCCDLTSARLQYRTTRTARFKQVIFAGVFTTFTTGDGHILWA